MKSKHLPSVVSALFVVASVACGGSTGGGDSSDVDSGSKGSPGVDSGSTTDSGGTTAPIDSGSTTPTDTGGSTTESDTGATTSSDSGSTSHDDSGTPPSDTGGTGTHTDQVSCGTKTCTLPQICCIGFAGSATYDCTDSAACTGLKAKASCSTPLNCASGEHCCSSFPAGSSCKSACASGDQEICATTSDCSGGKTCKSCSTPGGGPTLMMCVAGDKCPF